MVAASHVLSEKVRRPIRIGLNRPRLEEPLLAEDGPGLTLVCAPAGSGKSTLLSTVAARAERPVAWYRVTIDDAPADVFVARLAATLGHCLGVDTVESVDTARDVGELLAVLDRHQRPCLLILDDLQEIIGTDAERALESFLSLRPRTLRVALGSRRPPDLNVPLLRAAGAIHEVSADDLRFRVWEVEELFTVVHGEPLSPETAAALTRRTGGWAAGLQLFHLATAHKSGLARQQAVAALSARTRLLRSYLARNVLDELSGERRDFLVQTCALGVLSGALCDALLQTTGSAEVLEDLERSQLFTTSVDDGLTFRYHEVLQRHLELALLADRGVEGARRWYARCAALLHRAGHYTDALRAYARAEDWAAVSYLGQRNSAEVTTAIATDAEGLLPARLLRDDPWLALAEARRRLRRGAVVEAVAGFRQAEAMLDQARFASAVAAERAAAALWCPPSEAPSSHVPPSSVPPSHPPGPIERLRELTRGVTTTRPVLPAGEPRSAPDDPYEGLERAAQALLAGTFATASVAFARLVLDAADVTMPRLAAQLGGVVADLAREQMSDSAERLEEITVDATGSGYPWIERLARGLHAMVLAVRTSSPWRLEACSELLGECEREGDCWGAALLQLGTAVAAGVMHDPGSSERFADARARFAELDAAALAAWADTLAARWPAHPGRVTVRVTCLGGFDLAVAGRSTDLSELRPRALALLRLLALEHDRPVHRERLIDVLWPDATLTVGTRRLQVAISSIRHVVQRVAPEIGEVVLRSGDSYRLLLPDADVDVRTFERLLTEATGARDVDPRIALRERALACYVGDLFPEDGAAEHVVDERSRLRLMAAGAACALGADLLDQGRHAEAVSAARRSIELDRYQDLAWRLLVDAHTGSGDRSAAARARREHETVQADLVPLSAR